MRASSESSEAPKSLLYEFTRLIKIEISRDGNRVIEVGVVQRRVMEGVIGVVDEYFNLL
jgi:hypothetical protein